MTCLPEVVSYEDLLVWKRAMDLVVRIYGVTERFPRSEVYGLANQIRRAAVSIPANIAEGNGRASTRAYLSHINIALGSQCELNTLLEIVRRLNLIGERELAETARELTEVGRLLWGLRRGLKKRMASLTHPDA